MWAPKPSWEQHRLIYHEVEMIKMSKMQVWSNFAAFFLASLSLAAKR